MEGQALAPTHCRERVEMGAEQALILTAARLDAIIGVRSRFGKAGTFPVFQGETERPVGLPPVN